MRAVHIKLIAISIFLAGTVSACSSKSPLGPRFQEAVPIPEDRAMVYLYRPRGGFFDEVRYFRVGVGLPWFTEYWGRRERMSAEVSDGSYSAVPCAPGKTSFWIKSVSKKATRDPSALQCTNALTLDLKPGETYFLKIGEGLLCGIVVESPEIASEEIRKCRLTLDTHEVSESEDIVTCENAESCYDAGKAFEAEKEDLRLAYMSKAIYMDPNFLPPYLAVLNAYAGALVREYEAVGRMNQGLWYAFLPYASRFITLAGEKEDIRGLWDMNDLDNLLTRVTRLHEKAPNYPKLKKLAGIIEKLIESIQ